MPTKPSQVLDCAEAQQRAGVLGTALHLSTVPCDPPAAPTHLELASPPLTPFHLTIVVTGLPLTWAPSCWEMLLQQCSVPCLPQQETHQAVPGALNPELRGETSPGQSPLVHPCSGVWGAPSPAALPGLGEIVLEKGMRAGQAMRG